MRLHLALCLVLPVAAGCAARHRPHPARPPQPSLHLTETAPEAEAEREAPAASPTVEVGVLPCISAPAIDAWEARLAPKRELWRHMLESPRRGGPYHATVRTLVAEARLPPGLALLPAIESGYRPSATGPRGSRGLWQLGRATARKYGLVVTHELDERVSVERATRAALRHLRDLHAKYETWPLALAAYNAGEGRVDRALARHPRASYWTLSGNGSLPPVTRKYVPKLLALVRLVYPELRCGLVPRVAAVTDRALARVVPWPPPARRR